jgi:tricorn protease
MPRLALHLLAASLVLGVAAPAVLPAQTRLLRQPTISAQHIAFSYANNLWVVGREGGDARRLTSFQGVTSNPKFSPDGRLVAFSGQYGGNTDVYVVPVEGGEPRRLTWHPGADIVQGWSPDGARIVFASGREAAPSGNAVRFWSVAPTGGNAAPLPMPRAWQGKYSPDGTRFAYRMATSWDDEWRNYRGGQNRPIWILDLATHDLETPPWTDSKDIDPVWVGDVVYFISDRDWAANVWSYDTRTKQLAQVTRFTDFDVKSLDAGGGAVIFEQAGYLHLLDPATRQHRRLDVTVRGDFPWLVPQWQDVTGRLANLALSPTGRRVAAEARGEIFTIPAEKGDVRNLTRTAGAAERTPSWSPDGKTVAYFSDASGEYQLVLAPADGLGERRTIALPDPSYYFTPAWSPDGTKLTYTDTHLNLWVLDVASGRARTVDTDQYMVPERSMNPVWSPDSRYVAYVKRLPTQLRAIWVYDATTQRTRQLTDGLSDAMSPAWDASGRYLWFLASTNFALRTGWLDMTSYDRPVTRALYLAVLAKGEPSPLPPESDEDPGLARTAATAAAGGSGPGTGAAASAPRPPAVTIDFDGLADRILSVDVTPRDYADLKAGPAGTVFFLESVPASGVAGGGNGATLHRYVLKDRRAAPYTGGVQQYVVSMDGRKVLWRSGTTLTLGDTDKPAPTGASGRVAATLRMQVDPRAEFRQMFTEGWRNQREFLYVPNLHGADYERTKAMYAPLLEHVGHREDFNYLLDMLGAEIAVGHSYVRGGDYPAVPPSNVGLLGADWRVEDGRHRLARIYTGESWNPELRAPLAGPGIDVRIGDYLLAVDGVEVTGADNLYRAFEGTANRQVVLTLNGTPSLTGARRVTVVPVANEGGLRTRAWVEDNRRLVDSLSGGKLAYVYVPNTGQPGYTSFNRYFFAQQDRQGVIIDERFNGGGSAADYIIEVLQRDFDGYFNNPVGERTLFTSPTAGIWGPKVMIINEMAGSGGDLMPYMFKRRKIGPLVGKRTWGGLVGTWDTPPLIDGGSMIAPRGGFIDRDGKWAVENEGVAPDIDVENTPKEVIAGRDPQLLRAVEEALRLLREQPVELKKEPPFPIRSRRPAR